jgi:hypothetical protein
MILKSSQLNRLCRKPRDHVYPTWDKDGKEKDGSHRAKHRSHTVHAKGRRSEHMELNLTKNEEVEEEQRESQ